MRRGQFEISIDQGFRQVIESCAAPVPGRRTTWISPEFIDAFDNLHKEGYAHSIEYRRGGELLGGVYGVAVGGFFAGESMFHRVTDASKIALVALVEHLRACEFVLLDTQWLTPHLQQFGGIQISRSHYLRVLRKAVELPRRFC